MLANCDPSLSCSSRTQLLSSFFKMYDLTLKKTSPWVRIKSIFKLGSIVHILSLILASLRVETKPKMGNPNKISNPYILF